MFKTYEDILKEIPIEKHKILESLGFIIIRPDSIIKGIEKNIIRDLEDKGLYVVGFKYKFLDKREIEEIYRYTQFDLIKNNVRPVWWLTYSMYQTSPALVLLVSGNYPHDYKDCAEYINDLKGSANPAETKKHHLRNKYNSQNVLLCTMHSSDYTKDVIRESRVVFSTQELLNGIDNSEEAIQNKKPKIHHYLEGYLDTLNNDIRTEDFFKVMINLKKRIYLSICLRGDDFFSNKDLLTEYNNIIITLDTKDNYLDKVYTFHNFVKFESILIKREELDQKILNKYRSETSVVKCQLLNLLKVYNQLCDFRNYDCINFNDFKFVLDSNNIVIDEWEQLLLETSLIFHNIQINSFVENKGGCISEYY